MSVAVRRNLLFFLTGALLALAAVLLVRSGDDVLNGLLDGCHPSLSNGC